MRRNLQLDGMHAVVWLPIFRRKPHAFQNCLYGHTVAGRIVASFLTAPGRVVTYRSDDSTIWSIETPSSRVWIMM